MSDRWCEDEEKILIKFFTGNVSAMTTYQRLIRLWEAKSFPYRSYEAMMRRIRYYREQYYWGSTKQLAIQEMKVGYLDIETTNLQADFGIILCWYIKEKDKNCYDHSIITKEEMITYKFDKRVVNDLLEAIKKYDILYVHYGSDRRFDIPFIRTRAYANNLEHKLPRRMEKYILDTYPIARNKLRLHSNRLDSIADLLGIKIQKTRLSPRIWNLARAGHSESLAYVALHCKRDVEILEKVHEKLSIVESPIYKSM